MLELRGAPALSEFRQNKVLSKLQSVVPAVTSVYAEFVHFADTSAELDGNELQVLARLLKYGPKAEVKEGSVRRVFGGTTFWHHFAVVF